MTKAQLRTEVLRQLSESTSSPTFVSTADVDTAVEAGYQEISDATEWREVWRTIDLLQSRPYYDMRTVFAGVTVLSPLSAFHEDTNRWLEPVSPRDLDQQYARWEQVVGPPEAILTRGLFWLGYWPFIGSDTGTVKQYATALPASLTAETDTPGFEAVYHQGLVDYALAELLPGMGEVSKAMQAWDRYLTIEAALDTRVRARGAVPRYTGYVDHVG